MMRIRFPNGHAVTYNRAIYVVWGADRWSLYTKKDGEHIASVGLASGAILEWSDPCKVENGPSIPSLVEAAELVIAQKRQLSQNLARRIKRAMQNYSLTEDLWR